MDKNDRTVARLLVKCLEREGVEYIFGIPGEENIYLLDALRDSSIRVIITRHEQGAACMADIYGHLAAKVGVCFATLGPGALNLPLGIANALLDRHPLVAIPAQAGLNRIHKESHQVLDLVEIFRPLCKWTAQLSDPHSTTEMVRKAFKVAQSAPQGPTTLIIPEDIEKAEIEAEPMPLNIPTEEAPNENQLRRAAKLIEDAKSPIILAGGGVFRAQGQDALTKLAHGLNIPVATTFLGKGAIAYSHPMCMGTLGFMVDDYSNFCINESDLIITVGYDLVEYSPAKWNPKADKKIIHINEQVAEVDSCYSLDVGIQGDISLTLNALLGICNRREIDPAHSFFKVKNAWNEELERGGADESFPFNPRRIVSDISKVMGDDDIVICDTGALKMWMSRLYPCQKPGSLIISNGLAPMGFALPGALGAKLARPKSKVLSVMGDGSFLMNSQEIETALREKIPFVILIWQDDAYGLIEWKQNLEFGRSSFIKFNNPDFVEYARSFGAQGYRIKSAQELLPTLRTALESETVSVISCEVDYSENNRLTDELQSWR